MKNIFFKNPVINIFFKDGTIAKEKDIPTDSIHSSGNIIRYWEDDVLIMVPLSQIDYFSLSEKVDNDEK